MKNLVILSVLFFSLSASAQIQRINAYGYEYKAIIVDSLFKIPSGDAATFNGYSSTPGALYLMIAGGDTSVMVYTGSQWKKVGQDSTYTAGFGIIIENNQISVDTNYTKVTSRARLSQAVDSLSDVFLPTYEVRDSVIAVGDPRYLLKSDSIIYDSPLESYDVSDTIKHVRVRSETNVWNARYLMGVEIEDGTPADGSVLTYSQAAGRWMHSISLPLAYSGSVTAMYANYREDKYRKAMERMYDMILELRKEIEELKRK